MLLLMMLIGTANADAPKLVRTVDVDPPGKDASCFEGTDDVSQCEYGAAFQGKGNAI